jgi:hypothetical protein
VLCQRWWIWSIAAGLCLALGAGCNSERDKGINRDKDRPKVPVVATTKPG